MKVEDLERVNKLVSRRKALEAAQKVEEGDYVTFSFKKKGVNFGAQVGIPLNEEQVWAMQKFFENEYNLAGQELIALGVEL